MIIGIVGAAQSGKDTIARYMAVKGFIRIAFADKVKDVCVRYLGMSYNDFLSNTKDTPMPHLNGLTPRQMTQKVGMFFREIDKDIWVKQALNGIDLEDDFVITDIRFENEYAAIRKHGGLILKVVKPGLVKRFPGDDHISEHDSIEKANYDLRIINEGSLDDLKKKVFSIVETLKK